ncbi:MAG: carbohydrate-binding protein [Bacteroidales bacterium]|jgi:hypothetical protein|nr:carbohydrate-binding protein [Bacteroidales bacterium]
MKTIIFTGKRAVIFLSIILSMLFTLQLKAQDDLPEGWRSTDIGTVNLPSKVFYNADEGLFQVKAAGDEYWGSDGDHGHFLYFETEEDKEVVMRVRDFAGVTRNAKVLIDLRTSLDFKAANMVVEFKINKDKDPFVYSCVFYYRLTDGGGSDGNISVDIPQNEKPIPHWLKLVRQGSFVSAYQAEDGEDPSNLVWKQLGAPQKLAFRGVAYMGIAVCGGAGGNDYAEATVDNLEVRDVENPYYVKNPINAQTMNEGAAMDINVTHLFGHFVGDYWTIEPVSTSPDVAAVSYYEEFEPDEDKRNQGEPYQKFIKVKALKDGVTAIRLKTNCMGFKMESEFLLDVKGTAEPENIVNMDAPEPWRFTQISGSSFKGPHVISKDAPYKLDARFFNMGGEGVAYHKTSGVNTADYPNYDAIGRLPYEAVRIGGAENIGNNNANEWMAYTVVVKDAGKYRLDVNLSVNSGSGSKIHFEINGVDATGPQTAPNNSSWDAWNDFEMPDGIYLPEGEYEIKFFIETASFDFRYFTFTWLEPWNEGILNINSSLEYTGSVNERVKIVTGKITPGDGLGDGSAFLYQPVAIGDPLEMKMYVDSIKNTGKGSFAGFMLRQSLSNNSPYVSFGVGAYEGLRLTYRWEDGVALTTRSLTDIGYPCWILLQKYTDHTFGSQYVNVFYSYDNLFWQELLKYPLVVDFFNQDIQAGIALSGGNYTNAGRPGAGVMKNLTFKINQPFEEIKNIGNVDELKGRLTMAPNILSGGGTATVSYKVIMPGRVTLTVYDSFGKLISTLLSEHKDAGEYTYTFTTNSLPGSGVYLLRYVAEGDYQYVKFVYNN